MNLLLYYYLIGHAIVGCIVFVGALIYTRDENLSERGLLAGLGFVMWPMWACAAVLYGAFLGIVWVVDGKWLPLARRAWAYVRAHRAKRASPSEGEGEPFRAPPRLCLGCHRELP